MTVIAKLNYDAAECEKQFAAWADGPGARHVDYRGCPSRYDTLQDTYWERNYKKFIAWGFAEFKEFKDGDITTNGFIIVKNDLADCMKVSAVDIFGTGWAFHLNCIKEKGGDVSRPFAGRDHECFRQAMGNVWDEESTKKILERIDKTLFEHDPVKNEHCVCYYGITDADKAFYREYDAVLRTFRMAVTEKRYNIGADYARELVAKKGVAA